MSLGALQDESDLKRWVEALLRTPDVVPPVSLPFKNLKFGSVTITYAGGSPDFNAVSVTHGLGVVPTSIQLTPSNGYTSPAASEADDKVFSINGGRIDGMEIEGTETVYWLAAA